MALITAPWYFSFRVQCLLGVSILTRNHIPSFFPLPDILGFFFFQQLSWHIRKTLIYKSILTMQRRSQAYTSHTLYWADVEFNGIQTHCSGMLYINVPYMFLTQWWFPETLSSAEKEFQEHFCFDPDTANIFFRTGEFLKSFSVSKACISCRLRAVLDDSSDKMS